MQLTSEQLQAVAGGSSLRFYAENTEMVVLRADLYEQIRSLVASDPDLDVRQLYPLVNTIMQEDDANDPLLDSYEKYLTADVTTSSQ